jgi:hypothetical protein
VISSPATDDPVWYVAYASNMSAGRLRCYLEGGRPDGARRTYLGCRDPAPPARDVRLTLPGSLVFAGQSRVWGGAMAFYDETGRDEVAARANLLTFGQLSDLVSQEARHPVGSDLTPAVEAGEPWPTPSGIYECLVHLGPREGYPMFCLTSRQKLDPAAPSAAYLRTILVGLREAWGWTAAESADYLVRAAGVTPTWTAAGIAAFGADQTRFVCDSG